MKKKNLLSQLLVLYFSIFIISWNLPGSPNYKPSPPDFCSSLNEILKNSPTNFEKINSNEDQPHEDQRQGENVVILSSLNFKSTVQLPGARLSSIGNGFGGENWFEAYWGSYITLEEAKKVTDSVKNAVAGCLKNYKVTMKKPGDDAEAPLITYTFAEIRNDKISPNNLRLYLEEDNDWGSEDFNKVFKVFLIVSSRDPAFFRKN